MIEAAQNAVLNELAGTSFKVLHKYVQRLFSITECGWILYYRSASLRALS